MSWWALAKTICSLVPYSPVGDERKNRSEHSKASRIIFAESDILSNCDPNVETDVSAIFFGSVSIGDAPFDYAATDTKPISERRPLKSQAAELEIPTQSRRTSSVLDSDFMESSMGGSAPRTPDVL